MYVPPNFTVAPNTSISFENCVLKVHLGYEMLEVNIYKDHFEGNEHFEDMEIWIDEHPIEFIDKIEYYTGKEKERLV
jgi:hypothetical protein